MSSLEKRLAAFRQLPLRQQLALIGATRDNPVLAQNREYIAALERIHQESLASATPEERESYEKAKANLEI